MPISSTTVSLPPVVTETGSVLAREAVSLWQFLEPYLPYIIGAAIIVLAVRAYHRRTWEKRG